MLDCSPASTPMDSKVTFEQSMGDSPVFAGEYRQAIGCLQYFVTCSRPDIVVAVLILSTFTNKPTVMHWEAVLRIFRYLKGTSTLGLAKLFKELCFY